MNRGTRMSSALALVTPRAVVNPDAPPDAALPRTADEPLVVVAKVPDLRPATAAATEPPKASWKPNWNLPRPKFRVAYLKLAAAVAGLDFATCWTWIITLPPIVKLGTIMASLVMSIWMFGTNNDDGNIEPVPASAWHQEETTPRVQVATEATSAAAKSSAIESTSRPAPAALDNNQSDEAVRLARDSAHSEQPTLREIQDLARGKSNSSGFDDGWPRPRDDDHVVARATVRPIPSHKEPYASALPHDASRQDEFASGGASHSGAPVVGAPIEAQPLDNGPPPPTDMARDWPNRSQSPQSPTYPSPRTNPYYEQTAVAQTPTYTRDDRQLDNRQYDGRQYDNRPTVGDGHSADPRNADPRYADNNFASRPTPEQLEAERREKEDIRRRVYGRSAELEMSRERARAERQPHPETNRW